MIAILIAPRLTPTSENDIWKWNWHEKAIKTCLKSCHCLICHKGTETWVTK